MIRNLREVIPATGFVAVYLIDGEKVTEPLVGWGRVGATKIVGLTLDEEVGKGRRVVRADSWPNFERYEVAP